MASLNPQVHFFAKMLIFWTFPQFSTKAVDNFVDLKQLDNASCRYSKASL
ncbi:hypothetical protein GVU25_03655 [Acinetobacter towneri]|nr:hypothetical protein GVU25_03655 [Acinetobacter towneri]